MEWLDGNAIAVYFNESQLPDLQIVHEKSYPNVALISVNIACTNSPEVANFMLSAMFVCNVGTADAFYIDTNGSMSFGEQAYSVFDFEVNGLKDGAYKNTTFH